MIQAAIARSLVVGTCTFIARFCNTPYQRASTIDDPGAALPRGVSRELRPHAIFAQRSWRTLCLTVLFDSRLTRLYLGALFFPLWSLNSILSRYVPTFCGSGSHTLCKHIRLASEVTWEASDLTTPFLPWGIMPSLELARPWRLLWDCFDERPSFKILRRRRRPEWEHQGQILVALQSIRPFSAGNDAIMIAKKTS